MLFSEGECWVLSAGPHIITTTSSQNKAKSSRARILKTLITFNLCYDWARLGRLKGELIAVCIYDTSLPASCGEESGNIRSRWELNIPHPFPLWPQGWVLRAILSVFCYGSVQLYWILRDCNKFQDLHCTEDLNWNIPKFSNVILIHSRGSEAETDWHIDSRHWEDQAETRAASDIRLAHWLNCLWLCCILSPYNRLNAFNQILV